ncbi:MAG: SGNH/GDSL hydrolase family protein [Bacteroidales bacterium]|nr:SGNH/GDSL hydrolase family protein [Bacteroidales bacterium]
MRKTILSAFLVLAFAGCTGKMENRIEKNTVTVNITNAVTGTNPAGDSAYDFCASRFVGFATEAGDREAAMAVCETPGEMTINASVSKEASFIWCYSPGAIGMQQTFTVPSTIEKTVDIVGEDLKAMLYCSEKTEISGQTAACAVKPLTSGVILNILDSDGKYEGYTISGVRIEGTEGITIAGDVTISLHGASVEFLANGSSSVTVLSGLDEKTPLTVGTTAEPSQVGAVLLPCAFTGKITVYGPKFTAIVDITTPLNFQAGYVKTVNIDLSVAAIKAFPKRIGVLGDSISTFSDMIPSGYKAYYPQSSGDNTDVNDWKKTYWGQLITNFWMGELDVNSSWSGGCVAPGSTRTQPAFTVRCTDFIDPDVILLFGGTNDCQSGCAVEIGEFDFDTPVGLLNTNARFRESYIAVIKTIRATYPKAKIICIVGNHIEGAYASSIPTIADHFGIPWVDFRGDKSVTVYSSLHPNAAGHAYMAKKIYESTLELFK